MLIKKNVTLIFILVCLLSTSGRTCAQISPPLENYDSFSIISDTGFRSFGDLQIVYRVDSLGIGLVCELYLSSQLVGVYALLDSYPECNFDLRLSEAYAKGSLKLVLGAYPNISKLSGCFEYSVVSNNRSFEFKGDLSAWQTMLDKLKK